MHLFAGRDRRVIAAAMQPMKHVQALVIEPQHVRGDVQRFARFGLAQVFDVALNGIKHPARPAVGLIDADPPIQRIHRIAEDLAEAEIGHMAVVVHPFRPHHGVEQP